jgi:hypothetical protein
MWKDLSYQEATSMSDKHDMHSGHQKPEEHEAMGYDRQFPDRMIKDHQAMGHDVHSGHEMGTRQTEKMPREHNHHAMMIADYCRRFWISLIITVPILILSPIIQQFLGFGESPRFSGDIYVLFALSSAAYFYGGYPFLKGIFDELSVLLGTGYINRCYAFRSLVGNEIDNGRFVCLRGVSQAHAFRSSQVVAGRQHSGYPSARFDDRRPGTG